MADYKIYKITNTQNGMVYIGKTSGSIEARWKRHCYSCKVKHQFFKLQAAIKEFGAESFAVEQIDFACTNEEANAKEIHWIKFYNATVNGYNTSAGGNENGNKHKVMVVETGQAFDSMVDAAKAFNVSTEAIRQAVRNPSWKCCGFHWKTANN